MTSIEQRPRRGVGSWSGRLLLLAVFVVLALYGTGLAGRPAGVAWDRVYDVVLFNAVYVPTAALGWLASRRVPAERSAWQAITGAMLLFGTGNALRTLASGPPGVGPAVPAADGFAFVGYVLLYVALVCFIRARVARLPAADVLLFALLVAGTSIDDYGTGYSSLAYLRGLPADELKLDRSLTADVDTDPRAAAIVRHAVALAADLGLDLVVEGVEDTVTGAALARLGCDVAQGFAIAQPLPVPDFLAWLAAPRAARLGAPVPA